MLMADESADVKEGLRLDLLIAVCALLISSLAAGASWWQARVMQAQTHVLQEQLGAQVWPYLGVSAHYSNNTVRLVLENNGLGPAVVRSIALSVDGKPERSFIEGVHAILGPHLIRRSNHVPIGVDMNSNSPGWVLRAGDSTQLFALTSRRFAPPLARAMERFDLHMCYCAITPGTCWMKESGVSSDPQPVRACREIPDDLLHASPLDILNQNW